MNIRDVENILGLHRGLRAPLHLLITNEPVVQRVDGHVQFRGLQPKARSDVAVLTPQADAETVVHEVLHANLGLGEQVTYPLARLIRLPREMLGMKAPVLPRLRPYHYQLCQGCEEFKELHTAYKGRAEHYKRM